MFLCLCMSPAIDATARLPRAPEGRGEVFKDVAEEENVGGKGINVARWLAVRGAEVACGGLLGEDNDRPFARELEHHGIGDRFLRVPGATRRNEMFTWPGGSVKFNRPAFPLLGADFDWSAALSALTTPPPTPTPPPPTPTPPSPTPTPSLSTPTPTPSSRPIAILSGSLPTAAPRDFYAKAVAFFKERGFFTVLDASGEAMRLGVEAGPDLIKPNAEECEPLVGFVPDTPDGFIRATEALRGKVAHAIISDGANGAWFDGLFVPAPKGDVVDTTAAGDTLLAEYCWRMASGDRDAPLWAVAAGTAACAMPGGAPPPVALVEKLLPERPVL